MKGKFYRPEFFGINKVSLRKSKDGRQNLALSSNEGTAHLLRILFFQLKSSVPVVISPVRKRIAA